MSLFSHYEKCLRKPSRRQVWITYCREWTISGWNYLCCATTWYDLSFSSVRDLEMSDCCIKCAWTVEFYKNVSRNVEILSDKMGFYSKKQSGPPPQSSKKEFDTEGHWVGFKSDLTDTRVWHIVSSLCGNTHGSMCTPCAALSQENTQRGLFERLPSGCFDWCRIFTAGILFRGFHFCFFKRGKSSKNKHITHCLSGLNWLLISWLVLLMSW